MPATPLLSVVVPFYGVEAFIEECLASLAAQSLTGLEVILVDDGSTDGSRAIAEQWCARDPRFAVVAQRNAGLGPARNTGAAAATGRYLAFADSDDVLPVYAYERLVSSLEGSGSDVAAGGVNRFVVGRDARPSWVHTSLFDEPRPGTTLTATPALARDRMVWNKVYRRSFWTAHELRFPAMRYEDWPVTLAAYQRASSVDVIVGPVYYWRDRESGDSITQQAGNVANFADRVASAALVTDLVRAAEPAVRDEVHSLLARVDVVAGIRLLASVPRADRPQLRALIADLVAMIEPAALGRLGRVRRTQLDLLRRGGTDLVRQSVRAQEAGLGLALKSAARRVPGLLLPVTTRVDEVSSQPGQISVSAAVRPAVDGVWGPDALSVSLDDAAGRPVPATVQVHRQRGESGGTEFGVRLLVSDTALEPAGEAAGAGPIWPLTLRVRLRHGVRQVELAPRLTQVHRAASWHRLSGADAVHIDATPGRALTLDRWTRPTLAQVHLQGRGLVVSAVAPAGEPSAPAPTVTVQDQMGGIRASAPVDAATGTAHLDLSPVADAPADDPVTGLATFEVCWSSHGSTLPILAIGPDLGSSTTARLSLRASRSGLRLIVAPEQPAAG